MKVRFPVLDHSAAEHQVVGKLGLLKATAGHACDDVVRKDYRPK